MKSANPKIMKMNKPDTFINMNDEDRDPYYYPSEDSKKLIREYGFEWMLVPGQMVRDPTVPGKVLKILGWMNQFVFSFEKNNKPTCIMRIIDQNTGKKGNLIALPVQNPELNNFKPMPEN